MPKQQPEARHVKQHLTDGFDEVFGAKSPDSYWNYMRGVKWGTPDLFFAALGRSAWVEAKMAPNSLEKSQELMLPRIARAGGVPVYVLTGEPPPANRKKALIWVRLLPPAGDREYVVTRETLSTRRFWERLLLVDPA